MMCWLSLLGRNDLCHVTTWGRVRSRDVYDPNSSHRCPTSFLLAGTCHWHHISYAKAGSRIASRLAAIVRGAFCGKNIPWYKKGRFYGVELMHASLKCTIIIRASTCATVGLIRVFLTRNGTQVDRSKR